MILETVRVVNPSSDTGMIINASDFDSSIHTLFEKHTARTKVDAIPDGSLSTEEVATDEEAIEAPKKGRPSSSKHLKK